MKKICFVTATRAEYGLLKWLMEEVGKSELFSLQIVATGAHLLEEQGHTVDLIRADGFVIDEEVDIQLDPSTTQTIAASMGRMGETFSRVFGKLSPDFVMVLGDRYELLPIVSTAFVMRIPVIHLSGGDVTLGAIDNGIRNAVTMLADYHFPGTEDSARNIIRMRGSAEKVWIVGEPGLDSFFRESLMDRGELSRSLGLDSENRWVLFTCHAETNESLEYNLKALQTAINALLNMDHIQIVATYSNADYGGKQMNRYLEEISAKNPEKLKIIPSLGNRRYLSFMKQASCVAGNSSSGIVEAPILGVPVVNIGNRQRGRHQCANIVQAEPDAGSVRKAIEKVIAMGKVPADDYWGDGHTAERIIRILETEIGENA